MIKNKTGKRKSVLIVGAGIAGLSAGLRIFELAREYKQSRPQITILEADAQSGGRAKSITLANGANVSSGAQWLHGGAVNPFYQWLKTRYPSLKFSLDDNKHSISADRINPDEDTQAHARIEYLYREHEKAHPGTDIALADLIAQHPDLKIFAEYLGRHWMAENDLSKISCAEIFSDEYYEGGGCLVKGGMGVATSCMRAEFVSHGGKIHQNFNVRALSQSANKITANPASGHAISADYAIFTASVGVIKSDAVAFNPSLSADTQSYLDSLTMGRFAKLSVPMKSGFFRGRKIPQNTFVIFFTSQPSVFLHVRPAGENVITIFTGGDEATQMEALSPAQASRLVHKIFGQIDAFKGYEDFLAGLPHLTNWQYDPRTQGAWSLLLPHGKRREPITEGLLTLAGEAFAIRDPKGKDPAGTMVAAWHSGNLAAEGIFKKLYPRP